MNSQYRLHYVPTTPDSQLRTLDLLLPPKRSQFLSLRQIGPRLDPRTAA